MGYFFKPTGTGREDYRKSTVGQHNDYGKATRMGRMGLWEGVNKKDCRKSTRKTAGSQQERLQEEYRKSTRKTTDRPQEANKKDYR